MCGRKRAAKTPTTEGASSKRRRPNEGVVVLEGGAACSKGIVSKWRSGSLTDVEIVVEGVGVHAHRVVLAGGSEYVCAAAFEP